MSDIYDSAYIHVMRHQPAANKYTSAPKDDNAGEDYVVNTDDFAPRDLQLFVESLETITRLEQAKQESRESLKIKSHQQSFEYSKKIITCLDSSVLGPQSTDEEDKSVYTSESNCIYDDTYFGLPNQVPNVTYSNLDSLQSIFSNSGESGVFFNSPQEDHLYEKIDHIRPRSHVISNPKCKSLKSRLISLIMKKQYVQPEAPVTDLLSSTTYGEETEETEIYDRVLDDVIQQQFAKNSKKGNKQSKSVSAEEKFLDKAMSFLNL